MATSLLTEHKAIASYVFQAITSGKHPSKWNQNDTQLTVLYVLDMRKIFLMFPKLMCTVPSRFDVHCGCVSISQQVYFILRIFPFIFAKTKGFLWRKAVIV